MLCFSPSPKRALESQKGIFAGRHQWSEGREAFGSKHMLSYQAVTALERQEHAISRLKVDATLTKCLLGPGAFEFFRFHSAGCLGSKSLYPLAILVRELSAEQKGKLLERAQGWPEPLAKRVARKARAAERLRGQ